MWLCLNFLAFFIMVKPLLLVIRKMTAQATKITKIIKIYFRSSGLCCLGLPGPNVPSVTQRKKLNQKLYHHEVSNVIHNYHMAHGKVLEPVVHQKLCFCNINYFIFQLFLLN